ncbi:hypothetical protein KUTeg_018554 [Tegillarca granosa]|uniref:Uncharacterized protein n=1 Tax=Tegillarca granosa TaxID=220873 RepID=A0ABQ9EI94_TEGGR|nr:hypothetical protein KUTeg_018554 [Tegillarca granosa]
MSDYEKKLASSQSHRDRLKTALFTTAGYDADVRPYCGDNEAVNVTLDLAMRQLIELNEPLQIIKANIWIRMKWKDCRLVWNSSDYGGIGNIILPYDKIWVPDITLYDKWNMDNRCVVDVSHFPYDSQTCKFVFGSWAYHGEEVNFLAKNQEGDLSSLEQNVEWDIPSFPVVRHVVYYNCCPEPYPDVTFYLKMVRKPKFYIVNIIIPSFLITVMGVFGFLLPCESGEKVSLEITVMLSLAVFQILVADSLPPSAETIPYIAIYFDFSLFLVGYATVMSVVVNFLHYRGNEEIPRIIRRIFFDWLSKIVFIKAPKTNRVSISLSPVNQDDVSITVIFLASSVKFEQESIHSQTYRDQLKTALFTTAAYDADIRPYCDITLYDNTGETFFGKKDFMPNILSNGTVIYNFPSVVDNRCIVDVSHFPYDSQTCKFVFGSWSFHANEVDFMNKTATGDLSSLDSNVEWEITSFPVERHEEIYACCPDPFTDITFYLHMKRKPSFYIINIIIPSTLLTVLGVFGFVLPCESGEKVSFEITVMLSLAVFQIMVADSLPPSAETLPYIAIYFAFSLFLVGYATVMSVIVNFLHFRGDDRGIPRVIRYIFLDKLSRITCKWKDCRLAWNASDYAGITNLLVPFAKLWVPDLTLYDKLFPYDSQVCKFVFGSWAYHGNEIDFIQKNPTGDLTTVEENVEWHITSMPAERHVVYYNCCPEPYPDITFYVYITRKPGFYIINILIPYFLITGVSVFGFLLPCETIYFDFSMSLVGFATIIAVIVNNLYFRENQKIPKVIKVIFLDYGCKITFVQNPREKHNKGKTNGKKKIDSKKNNHIETNDISNMEDVKQSAHTDGKHDTHTEMEEQWDKIEKTLKHIDSKISRSAEWKALAVVIDRLSFYCFILAGIIGMIKWTDCRLTWNASDHGGIQNIILPYDNVWVPDITLYDKRFFGKYYSDGTVYYNFPSVVHNRCVIDVSYFPYDVQICKFVFGSWNFHGLELDFVPKNPTGDLSSMDENSEWEIPSFLAKRHVFYYTCCPEPYPDVTFYLEMARKPRFHVVSLIIPSSLIAGMGVFGFLLPCESGEKVSLEITVMLSLAVFQILIADSLPHSADHVPYLGGLYFQLTIMSDLF